MTWPKILILFCLIILLSAIGARFLKSYDSNLNTSSKVSDNFPNAPKVEDFTLFDQNGVAYQLSRMADSQALILMSYTIGCPIARHNIVKLNKISEEFAKNGIRILLIDANISDDRAKLQKEIESFKIPFPILLDPAQIVSKSLHLERTADSLLIDLHSKKIIYRGLVDDQLQYGVQKEYAKNTFLRDSITSYLKGDTKKIDSTEPLGCAITYEKTENISYQKDVVPILKNNCIHCHHQGGEGPWAMSDYQTIRNWSAMIRQVVLTKRMPPRTYESHTGKFVDGRFYGLKPEDEKKLLSWIENGSPMDSKIKDPLPALQEMYAKKEKDWPWGKPDIIVHMPEMVTIPATGWLEWQMQHVDIDKVVDRDVWIKAVYYKPGNKRSLHHGSFWAQISSDLQISTVSSGINYNVQNSPIIADLKKRGLFIENNDLDRIKEGKIPEHHKPAVGYEDDNFEILGGYSPATQIERYPSGTGKFVSKKGKFRFVVHYKTIGTEQTERGEVGIYLYKKSEEKGLRPLRHRFIEGNGFKIPEGARDYKYGVYELIDHDIDLYGIAPHLHYRGVSQKIVAYLPDGNEKVLFYAPKFQYEFGGWDLRFKKPIRLPAGTVILSAARFDNSKYNPYNPDHEKDIEFGFQLKQEMFWAMLVYADVKNDQRVSKK